MRNILLYLEIEYTYLNELIDNLNEAGYTVKAFLHKDSLSKNLAEGYLKAICSEHCFIITDNAEGISLSRKFAVGYIFYETDGNRTLFYQDAECVLLSFEDLSADYILKMYQRYHNIPWTIAQTKNLIIRESIVDDIDRFYEIYDDENIKKFCQNLDMDNKDGRSFLESYIQNMYKVYEFGLWSIIRKNDQRLIGRAGIFVREGYDGVELGYLIDKAERCKGYAYECVKEILRVVFEDYCCKIIRCIIDKDNEESINLAEKLGFMYKRECEFEQRIQKIYEIDYKNFTNI